MLIFINDIKEKLETKERGIGSQKRKCQRHFEVYFYLLSLSFSLLSGKQSFTCHICRTTLSHLQNDIYLVDIRETGKK